jgi:dimethylaniline monooxygenase (N-oxide forming)
VRVFESEADIGGTFRYRAYDGAVHVSSKYLTTFTDLRLPGSADDHLPVPHYLVRHYITQPLIELYGDCMVVLKVS